MEQVGPAATRVASVVAVPPPPVENDVPITVASNMKLQLSFEGLLFKMTTKGDG